MSHTIECELWKQLSEKENELTRLRALAQIATKRVSALRAERDATRSAIRSFLADLRLKRVFQCYSVCGEKAADVRRGG